jgi:ABC-type uncharacterized transport system involved in gliding motility auxiliary subunit
MEKRPPIGYIFLALGCVLVLGAVGATQAESAGVWMPMFIGFLGALSIGGFAEQLSEHPIARAWWAFLGAGVVSLAFSLTWLFVYKQPDTYGIASGAAGALLMSSGVAMVAPTALRSVGARTVSASAFSTMLLVLAGAISVAVVQVARGPLEHTFDLTRDRKFTISDQTVAILAAIQDDITVHAFFATDTPEKTKFDDLMNGMRNHTQHLVVNAVDPMEDPMKAREFAITNGSTVVLQLGDRKQRIETNFTEENVANALVKLQSGADHALCWTVGRGEADPDDDASPEALGPIVQKLEGSNYQVKTKLNVLTQGIPASCEAVIIANPVADWGPDELDALAGYLAGGGRALVMLEPIDKASGKVIAPKFARDLARYGVDVDDDLVIETDPNFLTGSDPTQLLLKSENYGGGSPITKNLNAYTAFTLTRSMHAHPGATGVTVEEVIKTSPSAWGEMLTDGGITGPAERQEGVDVSGPLPILVTVTIEDPAALNAGAAAAPVAAPTDTDGADTDAPADGATNDVTKAVGDAPAATRAPAAPPKAGGRLVVIGDTDFVAPTEVGIAFGSNADVFLNSVAWLVEEQAQLGERPKPADTLELSVVAQLTIWAATLFLLPGACVACAVVVLVRRRYL